MNSELAADRLSDPRDVSFAVHALLGKAHPHDADACRAVAAHLPPAPTLDEVVAVVFARHAPEPSDAGARLKARSLLAAYFAMDPPVDPDPSA